MSFATPLSQQLRSQAFVMECFAEVIKAVHKEPAFAGIDVEQQRLITDEDIYKLVREQINALLALITSPNASKSAGAAGIHTSKQAREVIVHRTLHAVLQSITVKRVFRNEQRFVTVAPPPLLTREDREFAEYRGHESIYVRKK